MEKDNSIPPTNSANSASKEPRKLSDAGLDLISIPDHELLKEIGRGSYGVVWLARNIMGVYRAVKVIYRKAFKEKTPYERELSGIRSFEPISRSHPGFVDILHIGINHEKEYFYYVMELGDDEKTGQKIDPPSYSSNTLQKEISTHGRLPFEECLKLGIVLTDALAALHKHKLLHRDVKPSNIIFVNGIPKLADIGLVAGIGEAVSYVGTQGFIPPEGPGTEQADIFGLGKVLYEASTGKDRHEFPDLPTQLYDFEDRDKFIELNEVVIQACQNDRNRRYQSAWDMHSDLLVIAKGKSVKRLKALERRFARVKRSAGVSVLALLLAVAIAYPIYRGQRIASAAHHQQVGADVGYGNGLVASGDLLGALPYFADAIRLDQGDAAEEVTHRLRFGMSLAQSPKLERVWSMGTEVSDCKISPDNKHIVTSRLRGGVEVYDLLSGKPSSPVLCPSNIVNTIAYNSNGQFILGGCQGKSIVMWDTRDFKVARRFQSLGGALAAVFSPDNRWIAATCTNGLIKLWPTAPGEGELPRTFKGHTAPARFVAFSHNGNYMASASEDKTVILWNLRTGRQVGTPFRHSHWVYSVAFSPDDRKIATACGDYRVHLWDLATGEQIPTDLRHDDVINSVEFSPDGRSILTASLDGTAHIHCVNGQETGSENLVLHHPAGLTRASFSTDCQRIATACVDGTVCVWSLAGCLVPPVPVEEFYSGDGSRFLSISNETIAVFETATGKQLTRIPFRGMGLETAELNRKGDYVIGRLSSQWQIWRASTGDRIGSAIEIPDGSQTAVLSDNGTILATFHSNLVETWDVAKGTRLFPAIANSGKVDFITFNPDGNLLAAACGTMLQAWNLTNGQPAFPPLNHPQTLSGAVFSPNGKYLATCCRDDLITPWYAQVWSTETGQPVGPKLWHGDGVRSVCFSADSTRIATSGEDHNAIIWEVGSGREVVRPLKHPNQVVASAFSFDGRWLVTACVDSTVRLWDAETGDALTPPMLHRGTIKDVRFIPGGYRILAVGTDRKASIWNLPVDQRPVDDIKQLASLLAGEVNLALENQHKSGSNTPEAVWQRLQGLYSQTFAISARDVAAWREFEAGQAENEHELFAAEFYTNLMTAGQSNDAVLDLSRQEAKPNLTEHAIGPPQKSVSLEGSDRVH